MQQGGVYGCCELSQGGVSVPAMATPASSPHRTIPFTLLSLGTVAVFVAWLAVACYALAYLVSR